MRFLCDEMLGKLARLLRFAGYDTALAAQGAPDAALLRQALAEERWLVTRDRTLAAETKPRSVLVRDDGLMDQARSLARELPVDWLREPFTRCAVDNAPLRPASLDEIARMPLSSQALPGPFRACPQCGRLYWPGSHVKRMLARLQLLIAAAPDD